MSTAIAPAGGSSQRESFASSISFLLDQDPRLALVYAEISGQLFTEAARRHPERVINVGIREQLMINMAAGMALTGLRPIAHSFAPFLIERAFEQIKLGFAHQGVGGVLVSSGGGFDMASEGRTHQSQGDVALMASLPGVTIHAPARPADVAPLLAQAAQDTGLTYLRLSEPIGVDLGGGTSDGWSRLHGSAHRGLVRLREGSRGTVVVLGPLVEQTLASVRELDVTVLHSTQVRPFDAAGLRRQMQGSVVVLVEPWLVGTTSYDVSQALPPGISLRSVGARHEDLRRYGTPAEHLRAHGLDAAGLRAAILSALDAA